MNQVVSEEMLKTLSTAKEMSNLMEKLLRDTDWNIRN